MASLNTFRTLLSGQTRKALSARFPKLKRIYERRIVLDSIGIKYFYNKRDDALHLGKGVLPMKMFYEPNLSGWLSSEFIDIVCPLLPNRDEIESYPFVEGPYELGNVKINKGDIIFDCGASMGLFSIMVANFDCTCYAFEPMPANITWLTEVVKVNPHIILAPYAIGDKDEKVWFDNSEITSVITKISASNKHNSIIQIDCITLDSFVKKNKINRVDFIKADIEGAERLLLKGAQQILREFAPKISICKYHLPDDPEVLSNLILEANPNYIIEEKYMKLYAHVPK